MVQKKVYDKEFKIQAVKLGRKIRFSKAAKKLCINTDTLYGWNNRRIFSTNGGLPSMVKRK